MFRVALLSLLMVAAIDGYSSSRAAVYSYSTPVGSGSGASFHLAGNERITGVRVWEQYNSIIQGIQLRFGVVWSPLTGTTYYGTLKEFELFDGEDIIQISGKFAHYIHSLVFVTSKHRLFFVGQPVGHSFNMYPKYMDSYLVFLSGRYHGALTGLAAHWGNYPSNSTANVGARRH